jgi:hypothetical protein
MRRSCASAGAASIGFTGTFVPDMEKPGPSRGDDDPGLSDLRVAHPGRSLLAYVHVLPCGVGTGTAGGSMMGGGAGDRESRAFSVIDITVLPT